MHLGKSRVRGSSPLKSSQVPRRFPDRNCSPRFLNKQVSAHPPPNNCACLWVRGLGGPKDNTTQVKSIRSVSTSSPILLYSCSPPWEAGGVISRPSFQRRSRLLRLGDLPKVTPFTPPRAAGPLPRGSCLPVPCSSHSVVWASDWDASSLDTPLGLGPSG